MARTALNSTNIYDVPFPSLCHQESPRAVFPPKPDGIISIYFPFSFYCMLSISLFPEIHHTSDKSYIKIYIIWGLLRALCPVDIGTADKDFAIYFKTLKNDIIT